MIVSNIRQSPEFRQFAQFERSGKYLVCRKTIQDPNSAEFAFDTQGMDPFAKMVYLRNKFVQGDVRIKFEFVQ